MKNYLSILVHNHPGVLVRVVSLFSRRGFNIDSLAVGVTQVSEYARITAVVCGDEQMVKQVAKQLEKLIDVVSVQALPPDSSVTRGMAMVKVKAGDQRGDVLKLTEVFRAKVIDVSENTLTFEVTGDDNKINAFNEVMKPYGVIEMIRTGPVGLMRGDDTIYKYGRSEVYEQNVL